ncbi:hypothetical protein [Palleronia sp. THAF1]|uniref:hypothetical protein n=1 Tax=Palleronia sp. THAF1 TaxID=2587842 RepID=UPI0015624693|nr:hypothetical protein [Palleronia sp. THAF1]
MLETASTCAPTSKEMRVFIQRKRDDLLRMIEDKRVVARNFAEDPIAYRRGELATTIAAQLIARDGLGAQVSDQIVSDLGGDGNDADFRASVDRMLALFAAETVNEGWRNKQCAAFEQITGKRPEAPLAQMKVFEGVHRARAIAWQASMEIPAALNARNIEEVQDAVAKALGPSLTDLPCIAAIDSPEVEKSNDFREAEESAIVGKGLCCTNPVRDSSCESSVVARGHEQTHTPRLQDQELAFL